MTRITNIRGFDFHCHVDLHDQPVALIKHCEESHVAVLAVTTTPRAWPHTRHWTKDSAYVHGAVGLHPELVGDRYNEVELLRHGISESRLVGEVGLDGSPQYSGTYDKQKEVFACALTTSQEHHGRVISVHSRRAVHDTISLIEEHTDPKSVLCILHWFTGTPVQAKRAVAAGCYFSVNTAMLMHDRARMLVRSLPSDRVLTETDSPLMMTGRQKTSPIDSIKTLVELAALNGKTVGETMNRITQNAECVLHFSGIKIAGSD